jgi:hypothetical protein
MDQLIDLHFDNDNHNHITHQNKVINRIKNNDINLLGLSCTSDHHEIDIYKQTLHMLKLNTSVHTLNIKINYDKLSKRAKEYDEWCGILCDLFKVNTSIINLGVDIQYITKSGLKFVYEGLSENKSIRQINININNYLDTKVFSYNNKMLTNMIKSNTYIDSLHLHFNRLDNISWSNLVESLKVNKTLIRLSLTIGRNEIDFDEIDFNGSEQLKDLLQNNNTIYNMILCTRGMIKYDEIISGIKQNPRITYFIETSCMKSANIANKLDKYLSRNSHNSELKVMMLQDL